MIVFCSSEFFVLVILLLKKYLIERKEIYTLNNFIEITTVTDAYTFFGQVYVTNYTCFI